MFRMEVKERQMLGLRIHLAARARVGPSTAKNNTYAADNGPSCGSSAAPNPVTPLFQQTTSLTRLRLSADQHLGQAAAIMWSALLGRGLS